MEYQRNFLILDVFIMHLMSIMVYVDFVVNQKFNIRFFFEQIYFSDKAPQNKTIKIPNLNKPKLAIHHEGKWVQQDKEYVLDIAATKTTNLALEAHPQKINKVKQAYHNDDGVSKKRIEGDIYNIIETDHRNKIN